MNGEIARAPADDRGASRAGVSAEAVTWGIRLFAGRDPTSDTEVAFHQQHTSLESLRTAFSQITEFETFIRAARGNAVGYTVPVALLRPPADPALPWRFAPPTLEDPTSQLCTASQIDSPIFAAMIKAFGLHAGAHRKLWELAYIPAVLQSQGMIGPSRRGLGFGCGREAIPAWLAAQGVEVLASDAPAEETNNQGWASTGQYAAQVDDLFYPRIIAREAFDRLVSFRPVDMNAIPADLGGEFDFCWSTCALEHLGSLDHGLDFIENSLETLKPGGLAVHTTEFNLSSDEDTIESPGLSIYRRRDIERLASRLVARGHEVLPLNFHPGHAPLDEVVDLPPYGLPHLKLQVGALVLTSIGIAVRRAA